MKKHFLSALLMILFLAACGNDDAIEVADASGEDDEISVTEVPEDTGSENTVDVISDPVTPEDDDSEVTEQEGQSENNAEMEESEFEEEASSSDVSALTDREKAALILSDERSARYTFSADELINERYHAVMPGAPENNESAIFDLVLQNYGIADGISGLPEDMAIYNITPGYGNFASFIGFNGLCPYYCVIKKMSQIILCSTM